MKNEGKSGTENHRMFEMWHDLKDHQVVAYSFRLVPAVQKFSNQIVQGAQQMKLFLLILLFSLSATAQRTYDFTAIADYYSVTLDSAVVIDSIAGANYGIYEPDISQPIFLSTGQELAKFNFRIMVREPKNRLIDCAADEKRFHRIFYTGDIKTIVKVAE